MATRTSQSRTSNHVENFATWVGEARQFLQAHSLRDVARRSGLSEAIAQATHRRLNDSELIDEYAQAMACGRVATRTAYSSGPDATNLLSDVASPLLRQPLAEALDAWPPSADLVSKPASVDSAEALARLYEPYLGQHHRHRRSRNGVYYTPCQLARYIVRQADRLLRSEFDLADGLADVTTWSNIVARFPHLPVPRKAAADEAFVRILDPAVGGGVFLVAAIELIYQTLCSKWTAASWTPKQIDRGWQDYVPRHLLPRLCGFELMLPAAVVAHWQVFQTLCKTGYRFRGDERIRILLVDTLRDWPDTDWPDTRPGASGNPAADQSETEATFDACRQEPFTVILGNPPFSGISRNNGRWITGLLRGESGAGPHFDGPGVAQATTANYYRANGEPLAERKLWLQDDYVKFLRYAQWRIESTGAGMVGFVTNHGYLDNVTFRGMREQLIAAFPRIGVLDLHGSAKKKERAPGGEPDENVFGVESGIAVGLLRKPLARLTPKIEFNELWGSCVHKLDSLEKHVGPATGVPWQAIKPTAPHHFLTPDCLNETASEYELGTPLTDVMPVNSTLAVTARDRFVVAFDRQELLDRMAIFRDLTISDEEIRARFFQSTRSPRYAAGDTRGWKLSAARRRMANDPDWKRHVRPCLYRPFDQRWIYWVDWMVDWPRTDVNRHFVVGNNLGLIARRQMLPTQPCNYFWVSRTIPIDGVIRSDNRGSESAFPLFLADSRDAERDEVVEVSCAVPSQQPLTANFSTQFVKMMAQSLHLTWRVEPSLANANTFGPLDLFYYIYAQFHSAEYRLRYADWLRIDFPRVFPPGNVELFWRMSQLGEALVAAHTETEVSRCEVTATEPYPDLAIEPGFPKFHDNRIHLSHEIAIGEVPEDVWKFCVGGHQVCRKWWRDRRGRVPTLEQQTKYIQLVAAVRKTIDIAAEIDQCIEMHGGWPRAFTRQQ